MPVATLPDDVQIEYQISGDGPPLLLLLPQSSGPVGVEPMVELLAERYQVLRYCQRGTGRSSPSGGQRSMQAQADDAVSLLDALSISNAILFCHSTGCGIGLAMIDSAAQRFTGLVLVNPWTYADPHLEQMQQLRITLSRALEPIAYAQFNSALLFPPEYRREHCAGFEQVVARAQQQPHDPMVIEQRLQAILAFDARPILDNVGCPTLILSSADDQLMPAWFAEDAAARVFGSRLVIFPGGGHMLPETRGTEVADAVAAMFA